MQKKASFTYDTQNFHSFEVKQIQCKYSGFCEFSYNTHTHKTLVRPFHKTKSSVEVSSVERRHSEQLQFSFATFSFGSNLLHKSGNGKYTYGEYITWKMVKKLRSLYNICMCAIEAWKLGNWPIIIWLLFVRFYNMLYWLFDLFVICVVMVVKMVVN